MKYQFTPYVLPLIASVIILATLAESAWRRRAHPMARVFALTMGALIIWAGATILEIISLDLDRRLWWANVSFIGIAPLPALWLWMVTEHTGCTRQFKRTIIFFLMLALITNVVLWSNDLHHLWRGDSTLDTVSGPFPITVYNYGPWLYWVHVPASYIAFLISVVLMIHAIFLSRSIYRRQLIALLFATLAPMLTDLLYIFGLSPIPHFNLTPILFSIAGVIIGWGLLRYQFLDLIPIARAALVDQMSDAMLVIDVHDRIVDLNTAMQTLLSITADQAIGQPIEQALAKWPDMIERFKSETDTQAEISLLLGQTRHYYNLRATPLTDRRSRYIRRLIVLREITAYKRAEASLRESEAKYRNVAEQANDGILLVQNGLIVYYNRRLAAMLGYTLDELLNAPFEMFLAVEQREIIRKRYLRRLRGDDIPARYETVILHQDGHQIDVEINAKVIEMGGQPTALAIIRDMTEYKRAERALRESESRYRLLADNATDVIWMYSLDDHFVYVSPSVERLIGYSQQEMMQMSKKDILTPQSFQVIDMAFQRILAGAPHNPDNRMELEHICKDGSTLWVEIRTNVVYDENGKPTCITGVTRDINERKRIEDALRESEGRMRALIENIPGHFWAMDRTRRYIMQNSSARQFYGDHVGVWRSEVKVSRQVKEQWKIQDEKAFGGETTQCEFSLDDHGEEKTFRNITTPVWVGDKIIAIQGIALDITDRVQVEQALQRRINELSALNRITQIVVNETDLDTLLNAAARELTLLLQSSAGGIALLDETRSELQVRAYYSSHARIPNMVGAVIPLQDNPASLHVIETRHSIVVPQAQTNPLMNKPTQEIMRHQHTRCLLIAPLLSRGQVIGTIGIDTDDPERVFSQTEAKLVETIAGQIAGAIDNARLFQETQQAKELAEQANHKLSQHIQELQDALEQIKTLSGLLPICANCKKIRDDHGYWHTVETYVQDHADVTFSHSICPDCHRKLYPPEKFPYLYEQDGYTIKT